eukprot:scaffold359_cov313-Prasinococcus_capsulatus_cf.AAC.7
MSAAAGSRRSSACSRLAPRLDRAGQQGRLDSGRRRCGRRARQNPVRNKPLGVFSRAEAWPKSLCCWYWQGAARPRPLSATSTATIATGDSTADAVACPAPLAARAEEAEQHVCHHHRCDGDGGTRKRVCAPLHHIGTTIALGIPECVH